ncbi:MAG: hypothetical protein ACOCYC_02430 [bacterium]
MRRRTVLLLALFLACVAGVGAQDVDDALKLLEDNVLSVHITARITQDGNETVWDMELSRVTISGRAVTVRLDGSNVIVVARFTPYQEADGSILLVAQGETWVTTDEEENARYRTSFKSLPVALGEPVLFFPLGTNAVNMDVDSRRYGTFNIELEVEIEPYTGDSEAQE